MKGGSDGIMLSSRWMCKTMKPYITKAGIKGQKLKFSNFCKYCLLILSGCPVCNLILPLWNPTGMRHLVYSSEHSIENVFQVADLQYF